MTDWNPFFSTTAQVAITAIAVLFAIFQIKGSNWHSFPLKIAAELKSLLELFVPLVASLVALMTEESWRIGAWIAGLLGAGLVMLYWSTYWRKRNEPTVTPFDDVQAAGTVISFVVYSLIFVSGFLPDTAGLPLLAGISVWLLLSAFFEAWWLMDPDVFMKPLGFDRAISAFYRTSLGRRLLVRDLGDRALPEAGSGADHDAR